MAKAKPKAKPSFQPKIGRPLTYTPEQLSSKFEEYAVWVKENPRLNYKVLADGNEVPVRIERPLTLSGFTVFAHIHPDTFRNFEKREEFFEVCACIRARIETDQLEGALCEQFNPTIASRVLHLADRQDITTNGKEIQPSGPAISVTLDAAAASIIQSIGKQTISKSADDGE
jgi:hypothetical protein